MGLVQMSISGGCMIVVVMLFRVLLLHRIPKKMFLLYWGLIILRLLTPIHLFSKFSVFGIFKNSELGKDNQPHIVVDTLFHSNATESIDNIHTINWLGVVWVCGALILLCFYLFICLRSYQQVRCAFPLEGELVEIWKKQYKIWKPIRFLYSNNLSTPVAVGIFQPLIILPNGINLEDPQLMSYIIAHEYHHLRSLHTLWKIVLAIVLCVHWMNPLVWFMYFTAMRDLELACDESVMRMFGFDSRKSYALSLIQLAERRSNLSPLQIGFSANYAEERITAIMKTNVLKSSRFYIVLSLCLFLGAILVFTTTPVAAANSEFTASSYYDPDSKYAGMSLEEVYAEYEPFGISAVVESDYDFNLYYQGHPILYFEDVLNEDEHGQTMRIVQDPNGKHTIHTKRDEFGVLLGIDVTP